MDTENSSSFLPSHLSHIQQGYPYLPQSSLEERKSVCSFFPHSSAFQDLWLSPSCPLDLVLSIAPMAGHHAATAASQRTEQRLFVGYMPMHTS